MEEAGAAVGCNVGSATRPAVTVVVVAHNQERFVEQCLDSVAKQIFDDFETIIIDDCSTDGSVERIEAWLDRTSFPARFLVNDRCRGICATGNRALRHSRGDFVSMVSADDFLEPDKLARQYRFLEQLDTSVAAVFSNARLVDERGRELGLALPSGEPPAEGRIFEALIVGNFLTSPTVMARRAAMQEVGGYDESLFYEDFDMWLKLAHRYEFRFVPGVLANYRILPHSLSHDLANEVEMQESRARVLLKWYGTNPTTDAAILRRAWKHGRRVLAADRVRGPRLLQSVYANRPTIRRRIGVALASMPGSGRALAGAFDVVDRLRAVVRSAGVSHR